MTKALEFTALGFGKCHLTTCSNLFFLQLEAVQQALNMFRSLNQSYNIVVIFRT